MEPRLSTERTIAEALDLLRKKESQEMAAKAFVRLGDAAVPTLISLLHDKDHEVRRSAAWALGRIKDRRAAQKLIRAANWTFYAVHDPGPGTRSELLHALMVGSRATRTAAAVALGRLGDPYVVPELVEALNQDHTLVRLAVVWALGQIGDQQAIPYLSDALYDSDPAVRVIAAEAIEAIKQVK